MEEDDKGRKEIGHTIYGKYGYETNGDGTFNLLKRNAKSNRRENLYDCIFAPCAKNAREILPFRRKNIVVRQEKIVYNLFCWIIGAGCGAYNMKGETNHYDCQ